MIIITHLCGLGVRPRFLAGSPCSSGSGGPIFNTGKDYSKSEFGYGIA
jgi:hypothetical protein